MARITVTDNDGGIDTIIGFDFGGGEVSDAFKMYNGKEVVQESEARGVMILNILEALIRVGKQEAKDNE